MVTIAFQRGRGAAARQIENRVYEHHAYAGILAGSLPAGQVDVVALLSSLPISPGNYKDHSIRALNFGPPADTVISLWDSS